LVDKSNPSPGLLAALANHPLPNGERVKKGGWLDVIAVRDTAGSYAASIGPKKQGAIILVNGIFGKHGDAVLVSLAFPDERARQRRAN